MLIKFDYNKLQLRIHEVFGSKEAFAKELGLDSKNIKSRLKGMTEFSLSEIEKAVELLYIKPEQIPVYFFRVQE